MSADIIRGYTEGRVLPEPKLSPRHLKAILLLVRKAWGRTRDHLDEYAHEPEISTRLKVQLERCLRASPFLSALVSGVADDAKTIDYQGENLNRRPDLHLQLSSQPGSARRDPLMCEAKVINVHNDQTVDKYCEQGMRRFVAGQYGWISADGLMLGYVRDESTLSDLLAPTLERRAKDESDSLGTLIVHHTPTTDHLESVHRREIVVRAAQGDVSPGPITLTHLWLDARPVQPTP